MPPKEDKRQSDFFIICADCKTKYGCCFGTLPPISPHRRRIIEDYLRVERMPIEDAFVEEDYVYPRVRADGYCVFHDAKTRRCLIHSVKPETCVAGPVTFDICARSGKIEWHIKMEKICRLASAVYEDKQLLNKHLESAKKEILRLITELDPKALKAILKKDEPETFKIAEDPADKTILSKLD